MPFLRIYDDFDDSTVLGEVHCRPGEGLVLKTLADTSAALALSGTVEGIAEQPHLVLRREDLVDGALVMTGMDVSKDDPEYIWAVQEALGKKTSHWIEYVDDDGE